MCAAVVERSRKSVHHHAGLLGRYMKYANLNHIELEGGDIDIKALFLEMMFVIIYQ